MKMEFKKYAEMKKEFFAFKEGRINYAIDSGAVCDAVAACDGFDNLPGGYPARVLSHMVSGKINSALALYPSSWDLGGFDFSVNGRKYFFDFQCDKYLIYDRATGRQLYHFIRVRALRVASFAPGAGWHDRPDFSAVFGRWSLGAGGHYDIEIDTKNKGGKAA